MFQFILEVISTNLGLAPTYLMQFASATNVNDEHNTSCFCFTQ